MKREKVLLPVPLLKKGGILKAQEGTGNGFWSKLWNIVKENGLVARDARIGAVGADQVRELYKSDKQEDKELAKELNDGYLAANVAGISGGATAAGALTAGIVPTLVSEAGGAAGGYVGNKVGSYLDEQFDTQWISPTLSIVGGLGGGVAGYKTLKPSYNYLAKNGVIGYKDIPENMLQIPVATQDPLLNVGWAPKQTIKVKRAGDLDAMYYPERWDVMNEGANPFGVWLQSKFGTPRTDATNPGKGSKASVARKIFADRKQYTGEVMLEKPMQTVGEIPNRSDLSYAAERMGSDGIIYNNVYDNGYNNNQVVLSFKKPNIERGYKFYERPSKLSDAEKLGIPKGERNQPPKPKGNKSVMIDVVNGKPSKEFIDDFMKFEQAISSPTLSDKNAVAFQSMTELFDSPWYKQRLIDQGVPSDQIDSIVKNIKSKLDPKQLVIIDDLNAVRKFSRIDNGVPIGMSPERGVRYAEIAYNVPDLNKHIIQGVKDIDVDDVILHEIGGHQTQEVVSDFKHLYNNQSLTSIGQNAAMKKQLPYSYYTQWDEVRARALTIAKQMSDNGWNPNSPEQVNVWLNKHIFTNNPSNVNQGATYYSRPEFIKAVTTGLKSGGKLM